MTPVCPACGNPVGADETFCRVCGRQLKATPHMAAPAGSPTAADTSGKAVASLVFGLFLFFFPFSIVAIIFGHLSLSDIKKSAGRLTGRGLAIAGLLLGYAGVAFIPIVLIIAAIAIPNVLRARMAANESSAVAGTRTLMTAEMSYASGHPEEGYTCSLSKLAQADLIAGALAQGQKNGYAFALSGCDPEPSGRIEHYRIVAYPVRENQTGIRSFCADDSGVLKTDAAGSVQKCFDGGTNLE
jgi:type IV pilus assembly protein PilA